MSCSLYYLVMFSVVLVVLTTTSTSAIIPTPTYNHKHPNVMNIHNPPQEPPLDRDQVRIDPGATEHRTPTPTLLPTRRPYPPRRAARGPIVRPAPACGRVRVC